MASLDYGNLSFKDIIVSLEGSIVVVVLNRSKQRNAINKNIILELKEVFKICDRDDRVRAVILTADPSAPAYCSGADISGGWDLLWEEEAEKEGDHAHRDSGGTLSVVIYRCRKITIAAVNGHAAGAGVTALQLPFDFRFVWVGAKLTFPFVRRGIVAEATSTFLLPRLLGHSRATSLLLSGATVTPDSPMLQGLYQQIVTSRQDVFPIAKAFADELVANTSQPSVAFTKALIQHPGDSIEENHLLDSMAIRVLGRSKDAVEGVNSFKERRSPKFTDTLSRATQLLPPWWRNLDIVHLKSKL